MEWIRDISTTAFFPLVLVVLLFLAAFVCADYGKKKGYSYCGCFLGCIFGIIPGIIFVILLPNMAKLEEQQAASFRYRDSEIAKLKAENEEQKKRIAQLETNLKANMQ